MILLRWPQDSVRLLFFVSRNGGLTLAIPFSVDLVRSVLSAPAILPEILPPFIPYALTLVLFGGFVIWNGGIVLGTYCAACSLCSSLVLSLINVFQATSRTTCLHFTYHSCITLSHLQRSWAGQRWPAEIVDGKY